MNTDRAPVYVRRLAADLDAAMAEAQRLREQADELVAYLTLPKFAGPGNDYVNVVDVLTRLGRR